MVSNDCRVIHGTRVPTTRVVEVNPGGSGKLGDLIFGAGLELRSNTQVGGGGGSGALVDSIVKMVESASGGCQERGGDGCSRCQSFEV